LDVDLPEDKETLYRLLEDADVFLQSYRPGSLAAKGFSSDELKKRSRRGIVCANLSAYGPSGPWSQRRGFDSLVQTCSGMNVSEAEHYGAGKPARPMPCQALDHASGYFLATGINAALYKRATEGGSFEVTVSLAGTMKYLRSLGQYEGKTGFDCLMFQGPEDVDAEKLEEVESGFGTLRAVKHSARVEGMGVGYEVAPKPLGSDEPVWLN
jgi:crotonobetainyl-CoA:carnitine CoA-transferase CaiB-like acyl-CoA transferase